MPAPYTHGMPKRTAAHDTPADSRLPELLTVQALQHRLQLVFPDSFPDRRLLVGAMAARAIFVFLYGGFVGDTGVYLRPSHIYFFTREQAAKHQDAERLAWRRQTAKPGFRPVGSRWYADNSRESIRDDLLRNTMLRMGLAHKRAGVPTTSSKPTWFLDAGFATLFQPELTEDDLAQAVEAWRQHALDAATLQRMRLSAQGVQKREGDVLIDLPDGARMRIGPGPSSLIAKGLIEHCAPACLKHPAVLWLSASDRKSYPQFAEVAASVGLRFDLNAELPDLILADLDHPPLFVFCEIVATDGPMTEGRKQALQALVSTHSAIPLSRLRFVTAYEDRNSPVFRRHFSQLATDSYVWFRTEPGLLVHLSRLNPASLA